MPKGWNETTEKTSRTWIKDSIIGVDSSLPVMITPFYFSGKEDFIGQCFQSQVDSMNKPDYDKYEVRFAVISFLRFEDSRTEGCDDDPVTWVFYNIHIYKQYKDVRSNGTNSHDELLALAVKIRNAFLDEREHPSLGEALSRWPLSMPNNLQRRAESEFLAGSYGDIINLQVRMEVR